MAVVAVSGCLALSACQSPSSRQAEPAPPATPSPTATIGKPYTIDPQASDIRLLVYRDGPLARVGHNHVMSGKVEGVIFVADSAADSGFRLRIPADSFQVDLPEQRAEEGADFATLPSEPARKGTRDNMLGPEVLDAVHHPEIRIDSVGLIGPRWDPIVTARITLRGQTSLISFPAAVVEQGDNLTVVATFQVVQTAMGMEPYSVLGGAVRVRDGIDVRIRLVAHPAK